MGWLDYIVLVVYFLAMAAIGVASMLKIKKQEDYFLGGRGFGKILQAFAAFGAGTGSYDPVSTGQTTFKSGLSGIWSVFLWLPVTPFYWFFGVWFRRMRHLTLGDWFVERYQSKLMGAAYAVFGIVFFMVFLGLGFSAVGKVCAPLIGTETFRLPGLDGPVPVENVLVPVIALVVTVYGVLGGLRAAYWTDLIQGVFIILLSILLIPAGLNTLVDQFGDPETMSTLDGFRIMHDRVHQDKFEIFGTPASSEFPLHYIVAITLLALVGIVVQPHLIAIGGGSAKTETAARVGLMAGTFLKRFCTVGWALTALIILAAMADNADLRDDPGQVWGVAAREILGPMGLGLVGLMLACLIAALMSSADCYMLIVSGLVVRNGYAAYVNANASERTYVLAGRVAGVVVIVGGAILALSYGDVFEQLKTAWELPILFAAPFWVVPFVLPRVFPSLAEHPRFTAANDRVTTIVTRPAAPTDVEQSEADVTLWKKKVEAWINKEGPKSDEAVIEKYGPCPEPIVLDQRIDDVFTTGGRAIYWKKGVEPIDENGNLLRYNQEGRVTAVVEQSDEGPRDVPVAAGLQWYVLEEVERTEKGNTQIIRRRFRDDCRLRGKGSFQLDFLVYDALRIRLTEATNPTLETLRLPTRLVLPFVVMILVSLFTPLVDKQALDRFYVKMKTPTDPDAAVDRAEIEASYRDPSRFDDRRLFRRFGLEIQRPKWADVAGFLVGLLICFGIIGLTVWLAGLGS
ncbi:MAG: sodium:solute symporter family protein [Planctomycetota bacterium]|jgi:SSS family solute:Na+ symporter